MMHAVGIGFVIDVFGKSPSGKNVMDFPYTDGGKTCLLYGIQKGLLGRLQRKIVAVCGALKISGRAYKGTGNDPAYTVLALQKLTGNAAVFVKLLRRDNFLMGGKLKHRIGRGVNNQIPGAQMLCPVVFNYRSAGPGGVGKDAPAGGGLKRL